jgi:hypothetical protein
MKTTGRAIALALALALALVACTRGDGNDNGGASGEPRRSGGTPQPTATGSVPANPNVYRYANAGLVATIDLATNTLEIQNDSGHDLAKPAFYVLAANDGHQVDGKVIDATPVLSGGTATFDISLTGIDRTDIGLMILLVGKDNYGAFVQQ